MSALEQHKIDSPFKADEGYFNEFFRRVQSRVGITPEDLMEGSSTVQSSSAKPVKLQYSAQLKVEFGQARPAVTQDLPKTTEPAAEKKMGKENIEKIEIAPLIVEPNPTPAWRNFAAEWSQESQEIEEVIEPEIQAVAPATAIDQETESFEEVVPEIQAVSTFEPAPMSVIPNEQEMARLKAELEKQEEYSRVESHSAPTLQPAFAPITGSNRTQILMNSLGAVASLVAVFAAYFIWQGIQRPVTIDEYVDTSLASRGIGPVATPVVEAVASEGSVSAALVSTILEEETLVEVSKPSNIISIEGLSTKGQRAAKALESYDLCVFDDPNPFFEESIF
ncbi:MAG: hypothetical protein RL577_883 [Bacteroidota bacterium]